MKEPLTLTKIIAFILAVLLTGGFVFILAVMDGFIFSKLWEWWIAPLFNLRNISMIEAFMIGLVVGYYRNPIKGQKTDIKATLQKDVMILFIAYVLTFYK